jgi:hypothetical protein
MAQAANKHTRIDDLDDLLRYLTEELGFQKGFAIYAMNQHYHDQLDGQLRLEKQDLILDDEPYGDWIAINAEFGDLKLDRDGHVQVIPRIKFWRKGRYRIAEGCDVRAIWPPRPPASFRTGAAGRPTAADFVLDEAERRIAKEEITPTEGGLADFSRKLFKWYDKERITFKPHGPKLTAGSIENIVRDLWRAALRAQPTKKK